MEGYHKVYDLSPLITGWTICVFVVRVFKKFVSPEVFDLGVILADETGTRIEAIIDRRLARFYFDRIQENEWKRVTSFQVCNNSDPVKAISSENVICFTDQTVVISASPREAVTFFEFTPFDYIMDKTVDINVLVDVIGALIEVGDLIYANDGAKIEFKLKDRYMEVLHCEAYDENAVEFDKNYRRYGRRNVVVALAFWKVTDDYCLRIASYDRISKVYAEPDVPEVEEIKMVVY